MTPSERIYCQNVSKQKTLWYGKAISAELIKKGTEGQPEGKCGVTFKLWTFKVRKSLNVLFLDSKCQKSIFPIKTLDMRETSHTCNAIHSYRMTSLEKKIHYSWGR